MNVGPCSTSMNLSYCPRLLSEGNKFDLSCYVIRRGLLLTCQQLASLKNTLAFFLWCAAAPFARCDDQGHGRLHLMGGYYRSHDATYRKVSGLLYVFV